MNKMLLNSLLLRNTISGAFLSKPLVTTIAILLCITQVFAQKTITPKPALKRCGTMEALQQQMLSDPALRARVEQAEAEYQNWERNHTNGQLNRPTSPNSPTSLPGPVEIPVVVHVVLPNPWMINDEAIQYFIDRLNLDFSGLNPDSANGTPFYPVRGHSLLRFVMAKRDPSGNFTTGVIRKVGTTAIGTTNPQPIKNSATATGGSTGWDITKYYNVYVGDGSAAGLLGIAPNIGPGTNPATTNADGVCVDYTAFGPNCFSLPEFNMSRTAVHEIGHNFGLYHTFQGGCANADYAQLTSGGCLLPAGLTGLTFDDTPPAGANTSGCPAGAISNGCTPAVSKMYQNYMDYTDDACYSMFTNHQAARMEWVLENCRGGGYLTTLGGQYPTNMAALDAMVNSVVSPGGQDWNESTCSGIVYPAQTCAGSFTPRLRITNAGTTTLTSITVTTTINNLNAITQTIAVNIAPGKSQIVTLDPQTAVPGANALKFVLSAPNGGTDGNALNDVFTQNFNVATALVVPYVENFTGTAFPPANGSRVINPDGDITWARTALAGRPGPASMRINLYNYDAIGQRDIYTTPPVDLSAFDSLRVNFYVAHQQYGDASTPPTNDSLRVLYSPDCGATWYPTSFAKGGAVLSTVAGTTDVDFVPANVNQWRKESVILTGFCDKGYKSVLIGFESYTDFGNNIYVDSINIVGIRSAAVNAGVLAITNPLNALCAGGFTPEATIINQGTDTLRSLKVSYVLDNGVDTVTFNWTGVLGKCESINTTLAAANASIGTHTITVFTSAPNGGVDLVTSNDKLSKTFTIFTTAETPIVEGFEGGTFPPGNWGVYNVTGGTTWDSTSRAARTGAKALLMNNPNVSNANNAVDYFISPIVVNSPLFDSVFVDFDLAYKAGVNYPGSTVFPLDTLELLVTSDCGVTFTSVYKKWGDQLQTVNDPNYAYVNPFVPRSLGEWKKERVYLSPSVGANNFQLYFSMKGNKQNNLWIDNINISSLKLSQRLKDQGYLVYPNPFNSTFLIHHSAVEPPVDLQSVAVYNSAGQLAWLKEYNGNASRQITVDLKNMPKGLYVLKMIYTNKTVVEKIIKN